MSLVLRSRNGFPVPFAFRRSPVNGSFSHLLDNMFEDYFSSTENDGTGQNVAPRINVTESENSYVVEAEIPGVKKEDVKISVHGKVVTLEAEVKREVEQKEGETVVFAERTVQKFARSFTLPAEVNDERSAAKLEHGILTLTLPKKEALRAKQIQVQ